MTVGIMGFNRGVDHRGIAVVAPIVVTALGSSVRDRGKLRCG